DGLSSYKVDLSMKQSFQIIFEFHITKNIGNSGEADKDIDVAPFFLFTTHVGTKDTYLANPVPPDYFRLVSFQDSFYLINCRDCLFHVIIVSVLVIFLLTPSSKIRQKFP